VESRVALAKDGGVMGYDVDFACEGRPMPMRRSPMATRACRAISAALIGALAVLPARAADITGHAITYSITIERPPPDTWFDAQMTVTLARTCEGWNYSSALIYAIERGVRGERRPDQPLSGRADTYQERLKFTEKLDGLSLQYEGSFRVNGRGEDARGTVTMSAGSTGSVDVKSDKLPRKVELPAGTLLPLAFRGKLIDALAGADPDKPRGIIEVRTVELGRFYTAADVTLAPAAGLPPLRVGKTEVPRLRSPLLQGRGWALKQTSKALADWMESTFEIYQNGIIPRFTFKRQGILWRADAKELSAFTAPKCGG
jgi:hypothetical protein